MTFLQSYLWEPNLGFRDYGKEALKKTGMKWSVLKCLHETLCDARLDVPHSINTDLDVARSMIETRRPRIRDVDGLLEWVEGKLVEKAVSLEDVVYWEDLLRKAEKGELTREEAMRVPFMEALIKRYEFLSYFASV